MNKSKEIEARANKLNNNFINNNKTYSRRF